MSTPQAFIGPLSLESALPDPARALLVPLERHEFSYHALLCTYNQSPAVLVLTNLGIHLCVPKATLNQAAFHIFLNYYSLDPANSAFLDPTTPSTLYINYSANPISISLASSPRSTAKHLLTNMASYTQSAHSRLTEITLQETVPGWQLKSGTVPAFILAA